MKVVDRIQDWREFAEYMEKEYLGRTIKKYQGGEAEVDLMWFTGIKVCIWNIIKYALRLWNKRDKGRDLEKIVHYAQIAWTKKKDMVPKIEFGEE